MAGYHTLYGVGDTYTVPPNPMAVGRRHEDVAREATTSARR
jgi:hypothetical protein